MTDNQDDLKAEIDQLKKRIVELEAKLADGPRQPQVREPHKPFDPTARATMPRSVLRDLVTAVPDRLMADLRSDALKPNPVTQSVAQLTPDRGSQDRGVQIGGSGWIEPKPLSVPPGVPIMDRLMDMQDAIDKADLQRRLAGAKKE
jgi:hypothetical protein